MQQIPLEEKLNENFGLYSLRYFSFIRSGKRSAELSEYKRKQVINLQDSQAPSGAYHLAPHTNRANRRSLKGGDERLLDRRA
jgi:hypothetical protein